MDSDAPQESVPLLLSGLGRRAAAPLNVSHTAEALGYPGRSALERRITRLISTFATITCPRRDDGGAVVPGSQAKLYFTDPLLAWLPGRLRAGLPSPDMTVLTEMTLGVALARAIDDLDEGRWVSGDTIGYGRSASGNKLDFAPVAVPTTAGSATTTPIEGKWIRAELTPTTVRPEPIPAIVHAEIDSRRRAGPSRVVKLTKVLQMYYDISVYRDEYSSAYEWPFGLPRPRRRRLAGMTVSRYCFMS